MQYNFSHISYLGKSVTTVIGMVFMLFIVSGCTKNYDDFGPKTDDSGGRIPQTNQVLILNEGNFMFGNGSLSVLDAHTDEVVQEVFKKTNGFPLGDVPQSMTIKDSLGYIVVNNSAKIEIVNMRDFSVVRTITGFNSPRYMTIVSKNPLIGWVTDLYADKIWKVDLDAGKIIGEIPANGWHENILKWKDAVVVLRKSDSVIKVLDIVSEQIIQTYSFTTGIVDFEMYNEDDLITLLPEGIQRINLSNQETKLLYSFTPQRNPLKMSLDIKEDQLYFIDNSVFRYDFSSQLIEKKISKKSGSNFYGVEVDSKSSMVYVSDAKDYVQPGIVVRYPIDFSDSIFYNVGVNPQHIILY
jgi:hypothetical protein